MSAAFSKQVLVDLVMNVWSIALGMQLTPVDCQDHSGEYITGVISIVGTGKYAVFLNCTKSLVLKSASILFEQPEDEINKEELEDSYGELVNMVGGEVLALLPGKNELGLPIVAKSGEHGFSIPNRLDLGSAWLAYEDQYINITVIGLEKNQPKEGQYHEIFDRR